MFHSSIFGSMRPVGIVFRAAWLALVIGSVAMLGLWLFWPDAREEGVPGGSRAGIDATADSGGEPGGDVESDWIEDGHAFLRLQSEWESRLHEKANRAVAAAFGEHAFVTVNLELDPRHDTRTGVNLPEEGLPPNVVETTAARRDRQEPIPSDPSSAPAAATFVSKLRRQPRGHTERKETDPSLYGTRTERLAAPVIRRLSASIVVDRAWLEQSGDREAVQLALLNVVRCAVGFDATRGDRIDEPAVVPLEGGSPFLAAAPLPGWGPLTGMLVAVVLGVALLLLVRQRRASAESAAATDSVEPRELTAEELAARMREQIERAIEADADSVSRTLGNWAMEQQA